MSCQDRYDTNAIQKPRGNTINKNKRQYNLLHEVFFPGQDKKLLELKQKD